MKLTLLVTLLGVACVAAAPPTKAVDVLAFGKNDAGQLGWGEASNDEKTLLEPSVVKALEGRCVLQSAISATQAVFVTCDGKVFVSGKSFDSDGRYTLSKDQISYAPTLVADLSDHFVVMASLGTNHIIALTDRGLVFTWGKNNEGQLGYGGESVPLSTTPTEVVSLSRANVRMVEAGGDRSAALTDDGRLYLWGDGTHGEMGDGANKSHRRPKLVKSLNQNGQRVCQVSIGGGHVAAVTNAGDLYTWGDGNAGQLGHGEFGLQKNKPTPLTRLRKNVCFASAGDDFTSAISQDERMFLWGSNGYPAPFEKAFFQGKHPRQSGSGATHMSVLMLNGSVATWGSRRQGQTGRNFDGEFTLSPGIVDVDKLITQIAVGRDSTLLLAGAPPAVSLCACLNEYYTYWRRSVKFYPTCRDDQNTCGDKSCCDSGYTCCPRDQSKQLVNDPRAIEDPANFEPAFSCVKGDKSVCCKGYGCEQGFKCWDEPSCVPTWAHKGMDSEDLALKSGDSLNLKTVAKPPGFVPGSGVCGARKTTCPDDTCCPKGSTCCPKGDGSFGCCAHANAKCCKNGCCREGFTCDDERQVCSRDRNSPVAQSPIDGHCGNGKQQCPDRSCCGAGQNCCVLNDGFFGCCPYKNGICCADGAGCCPSGHTCDVANSECIMASKGEFGEDDTSEVRVPMKQTPRNTPTRSKPGETTCPDKTSCAYPGSCCGLPNGKFGCCDFINATCCEGGTGCCPGGFTCNLQQSKCMSPHPNGHDVPMKFTRDPKPESRVEKHSNAKCLAEQVQCADKSCCDHGSTCCAGPDGKFACCDKENAVCCGFGGCCEEGDMCDNEKHACRSASGQYYGGLAMQDSTAPLTPKAVRDVSAPGKCYPDEKMCSGQQCCPRSATCCDKGFGQIGCCPVSHGICCGNGGCCPSGYACDTKNLVCTADGKDDIKMLGGESSRPPENTWDIDECFADEQTCPGDGGCCLKSETCCVSHTTEGPMSACCPFERGVCCGDGQGCCPEGSTCDLETSECISPSGTDALVALKGSALHPLAGLAEIDCPDGSVCGATDTCCSLGWDDYWGEEIYGCCEYEDAICCSEFVGCCPQGYTCDAENQDCVSESKTLTSGNSAPSDPPPTYVCELPRTQCPNGKCCDADQQCGETPAGNFRCVDRGFEFCGNGSHACPTGTWCDKRDGVWMCSEEKDNLPEVKKALLRQYWGEDVQATCAALLIQESASMTQDTPEVKVERPPKQFWYPKRLVAKTRAIPTEETSLPTVLAGKVCQHLRVVNSTVGNEICYVSNANGHFTMAERDRVEQLVDEYRRRICEEQDCYATKGATYEFDAEELDPCPCREKPVFEEEENKDAVAGDSGEEEKIEAVAEAEENTPPADKPFAPPTTEVADEKPVSSIGMGTVSAGAEPVEEEPVEEETVKLTPLRTNSDPMQLSENLEVPAHAGDAEMLAAHRPETFMGKEACNDEDGTEAAVDLDGEAANDNETRDSVDVTLAQMNAQTKGNSLMPEQL